MRNGGTAAGAGNVIAHNRGHGVAIQKRWYDYPLQTEVRGNLICNNVSNGVNIASGVRNVVSSNTIYGNGLMGINLVRRGGMTVGKRMRRRTGTGGIRLSQMWWRRAGRACVDR